MKSTEEFLQELLSRVRDDLIKIIIKSTNYALRDQKFSSTEVSAVLNLASAAVDVNLMDNAPFSMAFNLLVVAFKQERLTQKQFKHAVVRFKSIPGINENLSTLVDQMVSIIQSRRQLENITECALQFKLPIEAEIFQKDIQQWIEVEYSPIDERVLTCNERNIRRMDSLARLFSLSPILSVCSAVTIDTVGSPRIIISANVGTHGDQERIITLLAQRLQTIKIYIQTIKDIASQRDLPFREFEALAKSLGKELLSQGGSFDSEEVMMQAASKFLHAICFDRETFSSEEKEVFMQSGSAVIVLPQKTPTGPKMIVHHLTPQGWIQSDFDLDTLHTNTTAKHIHAEQLLAHYLDRLYQWPKLQIFPPLEPVIIGVSKLCCKTCFDFLSTYPHILIRGHHGQEYQGVVNIADGKSSSLQSKQKIAATNAFPSPGRSPARPLGSPDNAHSPAELTLAPDIRRMPSARQLNFFAVSTFPDQRPSESPHVPPVILRHPSKPPLYPSRIGLAHETGEKTASAPPSLGRLAQHLGVLRLQNTALRADTSILGDSDADNVPSPSAGQ